MNRRLLTGLLGWIGASLALAQAPVGGSQVPVAGNITPPPRQSPPREAPAPQRGLTGDIRLRWICKQLGLDDAQQQHAESLIEIYLVELEQARESGNQQELFLRMKDVLAEIRVAKAEGNMQRVTELQQTLRNMTPAVQAENGFFEMLLPALTDEQAARVPKLREAADTIDPRDITLRPVHVLRAALKTSLSAEQTRAIEKVLAAFRERMATEPPADEAASAERVDGLVAGVRALLTADQQKVYDAEIAESRITAAAPVPVRIPPPADME